jgi:response regulator RpfG family c-di-GMP phosphodiesterase
MSEEQQRITVLLVDDEKNILLTLKRLLMDEDFDIITATSGEEGLEKLKEAEQVGLIVSDQRMNGMNGAEFLGLSRELAPHALRILLTGYSDLNATIDAINKGGACRYISKPWVDDELLQAIRDSVAQYLRGVEVRQLNEIVNQQKQELEDWNNGLKKRLLQSTATIREQSQVIRSLDEKSPLAILNRTFDNLFEIAGDHAAIHARTVSTLVADVARKIGLDVEAVTRVKLAALLHDIGKFGSLSLTLNKRLDDMSESESSEYRQHPARGEQMFTHVEELAEILPLIRGHHEAYNGNGFPDGLKGEEIPLGARLIAIADHIDRSARSVTHYRADYAMMNARYHAGTQLDPHLIEKFQGITGVVYFEKRNVTALEELEIGYKEIVPGMVIARDVESGTGMLLMQRGKVLDEGSVAIIRSHYVKNPPPHGIFIQVDKS